MADGANYRTFLVRQVLEESPATEAGIKEGDIIASVNGIAADDLTLTRLQEIFEEAVPHRLTIRRGEQTIEVTLTPRRLI